MLHQAFSYFYNMFYIRSFCWKKPFFEGTRCNQKLYENIFKNLSPRGAGSFDRLSQTDRCFPDLHAKTEIRDQGD